MRSPAAYSGSFPRLFACVFFRRAAWHSGLLQARCRAPTRGLGRNQWRQIEQGLFRGAGIVNHHRHAEADLETLRSNCLGHFWKAEMRKFSRAPEVSQDGASHTTCGASKLCPQPPFRPAGPAGKRVRSLKGRPTVRAHTRHSACRTPVGSSSRGRSSVVPF